MRRLLVLAALFLAAGSAPFLPAAQAKPEKGKVFGDWRIGCETLPGKSERCFAMQEHTARAKVPEGQPVPEAKRLLRVNIGYIGAEEKPGMVVLTPLGIFLPAGVAYQMDGAPQRQLIMQRCLPDGCIAGAELDDATWKALPAAQKLLIGMKTDPAGKTIVVPVSLNGLDAALASLK